MAPLLAWTPPTAALLAYMLLAIARPGVSLRMGRLGWFLAAALVGQVVLWLCGLPFESWQWWGGGGAFASAIGCWTLRQYWLVTTPYDDLLARIREACRGLLLECSEVEPGRLRLSHRELSRTLRIGKMGSRFSWILVPSAPGKYRISLLTAWLRKQFPGPVPRIRIDMSKE